MNVRIVVILSAIPKLDVFQIAENLNKKQLLTHLYTGYASTKNRLVNHFISRRDVEQIPQQLITDFWFIHTLQHFHPSSIYNEAFDRFVARRISNRNDYKAVLAWSGMGERTVMASKRQNKFTVIGRESCHISFQNEILTKEYAKYGLVYRIDDRITKKELNEYRLADKLYVCSSFVKKSFLDFGVPEDKIFVNPIGVSNLFRPVNVNRNRSKFIILFIGKMTIRKGLRYVFSALERLTILPAEYEAWFVGAAEPVVLAEFNRRKSNNWKYLGFVPQHKLPEIISAADVGVFPSLEDGFAQVVPQQLSCGLPMITTSHTGSSDFIVDGQNGYVVPPFDSDSIAEKIEKIFTDSALLLKLKTNAQRLNIEEFSVSTVSDRFEKFFKSHV